MITYKNGELRHKAWVGEFTNRIALVENRSETSLVLKIGHDKEKWERELKMLKRLKKSPAAQHVVELINYFDHGFGTSAAEEHPPYYLELEWLGESLADYFKEATPSVDDVQAIAREVCTVLAALHAAGVAHMDFKPYQLCFVRNVRGFKLKLLDFDSARSKDENPYVPIESFTPNFTAPEAIILHFLT